MGALGIGIGTDGAEALKNGQNALWHGVTAWAASFELRVQ
jgi:hypothetical protein